MNIELSGQSLSFVWQPEHYSSNAAEIFNSSKLRCIIDFTTTNLSTIPDIIQRGNSCEIKITLDQLFSQDLKRILGSCSPESIWIEYFSELSSYDRSSLLQCISHDIDIDCNIITGDIQFIHDCFRHDYAVSALAIKGSEASGFVSPETTLSLLSNVEKLTQQFGAQPPVHVYGGIGTAEGAAACLASGVDGIVFESIHWLTDQVIDRQHPLHPKIANLRLDHTSIVCSHQGWSFRAFDKGNSQAVRDLKSTVTDTKGTTEEALAPEEIAQLINTRSVSALSSDLDNRQLIALGVETSFCDRFINRYGHETQSSLENFILEIENIYEQSAQTLDGMLSGPLAGHLGTRYPFIQGGMACITDIADFALTIAESGGLPTIALGIKNREQLNNEFGDLTEKLRNYSYAVNIITLPENPHREEQLDWLKSIQPPFAVISAGEPGNGQDLLELGIDVIYVTSDPDLLELAWKSGIRYVVCEGHEGGGHVGNNSTLTLAQAALQIKESMIEPDSKHLLLAGGIYNRNSLFRAAILGAEGAQMGTAYLATREIIDSGCLTPLYQQRILDSVFGSTAITGESIGLKVRSLTSPKTLKIHQLEKQFQAGELDEKTIRRRLEEISVGSLYIGARGEDPASRKVLHETDCIQEGQFMSGVVSGLIDNVTSVAELHRTLADKSFQPTLHPTKTDKRRATIQTTVFRPKNERLAITGMALMNSLGSSPEEIWQACVEMRSGITEVPASKWNHSFFYHPGEVTAGKTYCHVGAFINHNISRKEIGVPPHDFRTMCESTKLTLWLAQKAITESDILSSDIARHRIGVLISQNAGEVGSTLSDLAIGVESPRIISRIKTSLGLNDEQAGQLESILQSDRIAIDDTTLLGRLNCAAGGFICNKYGFTGPSYSVTAACATSLVALYSSIQMIRNGILDAAVIGGGEELITPASYLEFSALGALAGKNYSNDDPASYSRPFDKERSGMVLGEGGAMIVIERESEAKKRGAHIHAYITGTGASNNHMGMVESVAETQEIALRASFEDCGYGPEDVDMIECHATSTQLGDIEEIKALRNIYPPKSGACLSSFKSQIGHTLGASGLNSLIHGICAMRASTLPPTLNYQQPDADINLEQAGFKICHQPTPWPTPQNRPRRFQVNAFGFGGANYVIQLEDTDDYPDSVTNINNQSVQPAFSGPVENHTDTGVSFLKAETGNAIFRIGSVREPHDVTSLRNILTPYHDNLSQLTDKQKRELNRQGLIIEKESDPAPMAIVFAGQGTHYPQMGKELYDRFPVVRYWMDTIAGLADYDILEFLFKENNDALRKTVWQQPALFILEYALYQQLDQFGLRPAALAGHSMGELTALCAAGCFDFADGFKIINKRAQCMEKASIQAIDPGGMIAVNAPEDFLSEKIATNDDLYFTNFNSPRQTVIGGGTKAIEDFKDELDELDYWNIVLPVSMAFHSPIMKIIRDELGDYLVDIKLQSPRIPVISNTTCQPYPDDPDEMRKIIVSHLESPVHWQSNVLSLVNDFDCRLFVEIGPQDTLCNLIQECVPDVLCINSCMEGEESQTLQRAIASLYTLGTFDPPNAGQIAFAENKNTPTTGTRSAAPEDIPEIIRQEIIEYTFNGVEKYFKPTLLKIIQEKADPHFNIDKLNNYLSERFNLLPMPPATNEKMQLPTSEEEKTLEHVISIIMEATGYERDEIEPEMDIRQDLAIKSSRLPVIIDSAEKAFNITVKLEDFMDVRTVGDLGKRIHELVQSSDQPSVTPSTPIKVPEVARKIKAPAPTTHSERPVQRLLLQKALLEDIQTGRLPALKTDDNIVIFSLCQPVEDVHDSLTTFFEQEYNITPDITTISTGSPGEADLNICNTDAVEAFIQKDLKNRQPAGFVLITRLTECGRFKQEQLSQFASGFFLLLKELLKSERRIFGLHISLGSDQSSIESILTESLLGLFLTAKLEYQSMLFRSLHLDDPVLSSTVLSTALNPENPLVQIIYESGKFYSFESTEAPLDIPQVSEQFQINNNDIILISGGSKGFTSYLARSLAQFGPKLILLGRTDLDRVFQDQNTSFDSNQKRDEFIETLIQEHYQDLSGDNLEKKKKQLHAGLEIKQTIADLERRGAKADYFSCDVTDPDQLKDVVSKTTEKHGEITGIIHGAGILKDSFIPLLDVTDFKQVVDVKLQGSLNLIEAVLSKNLRFIIGLSSIAAVTGNVGQANYCCGNRAMARHLQHIGEQNNILTKIFWLPPIEGAGMADNEEIKEIIRLKMGQEVFVNASEAAGLIVRELLTGPAGDRHVLPARKLPEVSGVRSGQLSSGGLWYKLDALPMLDSVTLFDNHHGSLQASRVINSHRDQWIGDHKPLALIKHPIFSTIMAIESFLECGRILFPCLGVHGLRNIGLTRMIECPVEQETEVSLRCWTLEKGPEQTICKVELYKTANTDSILNQEQPAPFSGEVLFNSQQIDLGQREIRKVIENSESTKPLSHQEVIEHYRKRSRLKNRYRVLNTIHDHRSDQIIGEMTYPEVNDYSEETPSLFSYPHYLLEGLLQIAAFLANMRDEKETRSVVPTSINEILFSRNCRTGETIQLEGELIDNTDDSLVWNCIGIDEQGQVIMVLNGLELKWLG